ncbi:membrane-spanning 4-domains subfamily A member 8-like [Asterias amurensis]|uniref:membrane-spanning 4-domains subfamily A member 8-like n=1 Tax=Asterias amurensis TaxID=7602 RepID=UPI003AB2BDB4
MLGATMEQELLTSTMPNPNTNSSLPTEPPHQIMTSPLLGSPPTNQGILLPSPQGSPSHMGGTGPPMVSQQYMVMIQNNAANLVPDFNVRGARITAHLQILCGTLSVILGIIAIEIQSEDAYIGAPIWTGIFFFICTGLSGELAASRKQNCMITGYLVLSILSAVAAFQLLSLMASFTAWEFGTFYSSSLFRGRVAVDALTALVALLELGIAIVASVIACRGTCCQTSAGSSMTVQYMPAIPNGGPTTIQNEHGTFIQGQPIQLTTCTPGQLAYLVPMTQTLPQTSPSHQPHPQGDHPPIYLPIEDAASRVDENDQLMGMEKVPLV